MFLREMQSAVSYTRAGRPSGPHTWRICEAYLEQFAPGESSLFQKIGEAGHEFGWTLYSPDSN
ncbi:MAG: hypothetical protein JWQ71_5035 [Pedosphaera sp.]|nr:hypothetical protein [Pedosphaera sp.]